MYVEGIRWTTRFLPARPTHSTGATVVELRVHRWHPAHLAHALASFEDQEFRVVTEFH
jgi:hypothetical protein